MHTCYVVYLSRYYAITNGAGVGLVVVIVVGLVVGLVVVLVVCVATPAEARSTANKRSNTDFIFSFWVSSNRVKSKTN